MKKRLGFVAPLAAALLLSTTASADQVLKVEEILAQQNNFKVDFGLSYSNIDQKGGVGTVATLDTLGGLGIILTYLLSTPLGVVSSGEYAGEQVVDRDFIVYSLNAKYGLTKDLELVVFGNAHTSITRAQFNATDGTKTMASETEHDFDNAGIGLTYKIKGEDGTPALVVGTTANAISRSQYAVLDTNGQVVGTEKQDENFNSYNFYALSYYTVDPIVFVLKASYQWSLEQTFQGQDYDHADIISVSPEVYFAVNPYTNLSWGFTYQYKGEELVNGVTAVSDESVVGFKLGMSYEIAHNSILTVEASKNDTATYQQSNINILFSKTF